MAWIWSLLAGVLGTMLIWTVILGTVLAMVLLTIVYGHGQPVYRVFAAGDREAFHQHCIYYDNQYYYQDDGVVWMQDGKTEKIMDIEPCYMAAAGDYIFLCGGGNQMKGIPVGGGNALDFAEDLVYTGLGTDGRFLFVCTARYLNEKEGDEEIFFRYDVSNPRETMVNLSKTLFENCGKGFTVKRDEFGYEYLYASDVEKDFGSGRVVAVRNEKGELVEFDRDTDLFEVVEWSGNRCGVLLIEAGSTVLKYYNMDGTQERVIRFPERVYLRRENVVRKETYLYGIAQRQKDSEKARRLYGEYDKTYRSGEIPQSGRERDIVYRIHRETGEMEILYETRSKRERIVAVSGGNLILLRVWDKTLWKVNPHSGEREKIARLAASWRDKELSFESCGDRLFVWSNGIRRGWKYLDSIWIGEGEILSE